MLNDEGWHHHFVTVNGIHMHYVTMGEGPLLVLLHGFPEFWYSWRYQIPVLSKKFKVVVPDMRGYGDTEKPIGIEKYRIEELVRDVVELISSVGHEDAVVAGNDWGGIIGWTTAMMAPNVVKKLIIMNAPHPAIYQVNAFKNYEQMKKSWYMFFYLLPEVPEKVLSANNFEFLNQIFSLSIKRIDKFSQYDIDNYISSWSKEGGLTGGLNYYRANINSDFWGSLDESIPFPKIKCPTLQIWGEDDVFLGKELTENTQEWIDNKYRLQMISNCGHWVQQEAPEEVNKIMLDFSNDTN